MNAFIFPPIPRDTAKAAQAVIGRSNFYILTGDRINQLFQGLNDSPNSGRGLSLTRNDALFYMITIFQYVETLSDHQVPDALRERLDWKYALHLPLNYAHRNTQTLCEIRQQLRTSSLELQYFQALIQRLAATTMLAEHRLKNVTAQRVLSRVCLISRVAKTWDAINQALEALATRQPEWLLDNSLPHWFERYDPIHKTINLYEDDPELMAHARLFGLDGAHLLKAIDDSNLAALKDIPEIHRLSAIWQEQYSQIETQIIFRQATCTGCSLAAYPPKIVLQ